MELRKCANPQHEESKVCEGSREDLRSAVRLFFRRASLQMNKRNRTEKERKERKERNKQRRKLREGSSFSFGLPERSCKEYETPKRRKNSNRRERSLGQSSFNGSISRIKAIKGAVLLTGHVPLRERASLLDGWVDELIDQFNLDKTKAS